MRSDNLRRDRASGIRVEGHGAEFEVLGLPDRSPLFANRRDAEAWMRAQVAALPPNRIPRDRACLTCGVEFWSEGAHHRKCDGCRGQQTWLGDFGVAGGLSGGGRRSSMRGGR